MKKKKIDLPFDEATVVVGRLNDGNDIDELVIVRFNSLPSSVTKNQNN